jgi:hypothetical protein
MKTLVFNRNSYVVIDSYIEFDVQHLYGVVKCDI